MATKSLKDLLIVRNNKNFEQLYKTNLSSTFVF